MADKKDAERAAFNELAAVVGDYLETQGWRALVIGPVRVEQQAGARKHQFELVIKFTGGQTKAIPAPKAWAGAIKRRAKR